MDAVRDCSMVGLEALPRIPLITHVLWAEAVSGGGEQPPGVHSLSSLPAGYKCGHLARGSKGGKGRQLKEAMTAGSNNEIGDAGAAAIAGAVRGLETLRWLGLA